MQSRCTSMSQATKFKAHSLVKMSKPGKFPFLKKAKVDGRRCVSSSFSSTLRLRNLTSRVVKFPSYLLLKWRSSVDNADVNEFPCHYIVVVGYFKAKSASFSVKYNHWAPTKTGQGEDLSLFTKRWSSQVKEDSDKIDVESLASNDLSDLGIRKCLSWHESNESIYLPKIITRSKTNVEFLIFKWTKTVSVFWE